MISQFWKKQGEIGLVAVLLILYGFQYYLVNKFVVSFPNWGDDLGFIDLARRLSVGEISWVDSYYPFHNMVHVCWFIKFVYWFQLQLFGVIDYKISVQVGQLLLLPILYVYRSYFKLQNWSIFLQISFFLLLFSLKGNVDNFGALGIFQHTITVVCIVLAGFYAIIKKSFFKSFLMTNCCLFLNSTEILGAILVLMILVVCVNEPKKYFYIGFSLLNVVIYYFGIKHSETILQIQSPPYHFSPTMFLGILTFLGGLFSNFKILFFLGGLYLLIVLFAFFSIPGNLKDKLTNHRFFPIYIFLSLLAIGILIQVGRSDPKHPEIGIYNSVASRFSFYHISILCSVFIMLTDYFKNKVQFVSTIALLFATSFYAYNFFKITPFLQEDSKRITMDSYNFFNARENINYDVDKDLINRLVDANVLVSPTFNWVNRMKRKDKFIVQRVEEDGQYTNFIGLSPSAYQFSEIELENQKSIFTQLQIVDENHVKIRIATKWLKNNKWKNIFLMDPLTTN